jgi:hypothetical protein
MVWNPPPPSQADLQSAGVTSPESLRPVAPPRRPTPFESPSDTCTPQWHWSPFRIIWAILAAVGAAWVLVCSAGVVVIAVAACQGDQSAPQGAMHLCLACIPGWSLTWLGLRLLTIKLHG